MQFNDLHRQHDRIQEGLDRRLGKVFQDMHFISGEEVAEIEEKLADYVGVKHVISCASGTDALVIPLLAKQLKKTDAVFVPAFTFFASGECVASAGGTPVFVDVDEETFNLDPDSLEEKIEEVLKDGELEPKGVIPVDLYGLPADFRRIRKIADKYGLFLLEDAAQGFGGTIDGRKAAGFGDVGATSFFPSKPLACYGDGGAMFTNDDETAKLLTSLHVHGKGKNKYDNIRIGVNSRLDTIQAAVLLEKLAVFDEEVDLRNAVADRYTERLRGVVKTPTVPEGFRSSWAQYTVRLESTEQRTRLQEALKAQDVPTMVYYPIPLHQAGAFRDLRPAVLPVSEKLCGTVMSLPMHPYLTEEEQDFICGIIKKNV